MVPRGRFASSSRSTRTPSNPREARFRGTVGSYGAEERDRFAVSTQRVAADLPCAYLGEAGRSDTVNTLQLPPADKNQRDLQAATFVG